MDILTVSNENIIGHLLFSGVAILFFVLGNQAKKSQNAVSFFTIMKAVKNEELINVEKYNQDIARTYFVFAGFMAIVSFVPSHLKALQILLICVSAIFLLIGNIMILKKYKK